MFSPTNPEPVEYKWTQLKLKIIGKGHLTLTATKSPVTTQTNKRIKEEAPVVPQGKQMRSVAQAGVAMELPQLPRRYSNQKLKTRCTPREERQIQIGPTQTKTGLTRDGLRRQVALRTGEMIGHPLIDMEARGERTEITVVVTKLEIIIKEVRDTKTKEEVVTSVVVIDMAVIALRPETTTEWTAAEMIELMIEEMTGSTEDAGKVQEVGIEVIETTVVMTGTKAFHLIEDSTSLTRIDPGSKNQGTVAS